MAESVDALVSNTSGLNPIPVRPRVWVQIMAVNHMIGSRYYFYRVPKGSKSHILIKMPFLKLKKNIYQINEILL